MATIQRDCVDIYIDRMVNKTIRNELSDEILPDTLKKIVSLPNVKTTNDALEALVEKIQGQIAALIQSDREIQTGFKKLPHPPEFPDKYYTSKIVDAVTEKLASWNLALTY